MSARSKWPGEVAAFRARTLMELLRPACERIEIVGSLRRQKLYVGDIELLFIEKFEKRKTGLFDEDAAQINLVDKILDEWLASGLISKRPNKAGFLAWGPKNKLCTLNENGMNLDLFTTNLENWFMSLVIRTGPKEFNLRLINSAAHRRLITHAYGVFEGADGERIIPTSEEEVLKIAGLPWIPPHER